MSEREYEALRSAILSAHNGEWTRDRKADTIDFVRGDHVLFYICMDIMNTDKINQIGGIFV